MKGFDISDNEFAKSHARYMIGGSTAVENERVFRFGQFSGGVFQSKCRSDISPEFPERPNALRKFLLGIQQEWNISLFHYRNHGAGMYRHFSGDILLIVFRRPREGPSWHSGSSI